MNTNLMLHGATKLNKQEMKSVKGGTGTCAFIAKDVFGDGQHYIGRNVDRGTAERIARETQEEDGVVIAAMKLHGSINCLH